METADDRRMGGGGGKSGPHGPCTKGTKAGHAKLQGGFLSFGFQHDFVTFFSNRFRSKLKRELHTIFLKIFLRFTGGTKKLGNQNLLPPRL